MYTVWLSLIENVDEGKSAGEPCDPETGKPAAQLRPINMAGLDDLHKVPVIKLVFNQVLVPLGIETVVAFMQSQNTPFQLIFKVIQLLHEILI